MHPIMVNFGPFTIRYYGVMIAAAFLVGTWLAAREAQRKGIDKALVYDLLFYLMIFSIIGARLYYVFFFDPRRFLSHPLEILYIWNGGLAIHGGLIGGLLTGIWFCRSRNVPFWGFADALAPSLILGQAIGRVGCTMNGCGFGRPTSLPWAVIFTDPNSLAPLGIPLHPTQLYEMSGDLIIFAVIWMMRKRVKFDGQLFTTYAILYGALRFIVEFFRGDKLMVSSGLPAAQAISVAILALAAAFFLILRRRGRLAKV